MSREAGADARPDAAAIEAVFAEPGNIHELRERFPEAWAVVFAELQEAAAGTQAELAARMTAARLAWQPHAGQAGRARDDASGARARAAATARLRVLGLEQLGRALVEAAVAPVRWGFLDRLFFPAVRRAAAAPHALPAADLDARWARLRNKAKAAVDLYRGGTYCLYPRELVAALAARIGARPTLELGAGRGHLARYLAEAGVDITAVDDASWGDQVPLGPSVLREEATAALAARAPRAVICSWPPPGNRFESAVFLTHSVELYIVLLSRHRHASGDWAGYERQRGFACEPADDLARLVLPREVEATALIFTRKPAPDARGGKGPRATR